MHTGEKVAAVVSDEKAGYSRFLLLVAGLGGLLYGVDVGIIAGALPYLESAEPGGFHQYRRRIPADRRQAWLRGHVFRLCRLHCNLPHHGRGCSAGNKREDPGRNRSAF